jgi:hypothetical protein
VTIRVALLVLGMHRSGTSVTAALLARLGFALPRTLMPADAWNAEGYFESSRFQQFHDRLLRAAGTSWDAYTRLDPQWLASTDAHSMRNECRALLQSEFGDAPRFVLKDPRICRFVPFWLQLLHEEGIQPKAVLVMRPPFDVARSLRARDGLRLTLGVLVWLRHVLDAEAATRTIPRTWAPYADTLRDWRQAAERICADLDEPWPAAATAAAPDEGLVNTGLQHHLGPLDTSRVPELLIEWIRRTEDALAACRTAGSPDRTRAEGMLDTIRSEFDRTVAPFGDADEPRYLEWVETAATRETVARRALAEKEQLATECDRLRAEHDRLRAEHDRLRTEHDRLRTEHDRLRTEHDRVSAERSELAERQRRIEDDAEDTRLELTAALDASRFEVQALRTSLSWRVTAPLRVVYRLVK